MTRPAFFAGGVLVDLGGTSGMEMHAHPTTARCWSLLPPDSASDQQVMPHGHLERAQVLIATPVSQDH